MTALITGASGGLGRALAAECAGRGYDLFLTDISEQGLIEIKHGIQRQYDVAVHTKVCNVTNPREVAELFAAIDALNVKLNMFLGVAGIDFEGGFEEQVFGAIDQLVSETSERVKAISADVMGIPDVVEQMPQLEGRQMIMVIAPKKK